MSIVDPLVVQPKTKVRKASQKKTFAVVQIDKKKETEIESSDDNEEDIDDGVTVLELKATYNRTNKKSVNGKYIMKWVFSVDGSATKRVDLTSAAAIKNPMKTALDFFDGYSKAYELPRP